MEQIDFEAQLCSKTSIFKEKHVFPILIILCLVTSLGEIPCFAQYCMPPEGIEVQTVA